jgi:unsaturated rhamnogalacturonyl hydrolase
MTDQEKFRSAADLLTRHTFQVWHYGDSIGFEGLLAASDLLDDPRYEGWVHGAIKTWIPRATPFRELDNTAPGHAMLQAFERTGDKAILEAALELVDFLQTRRRVRGAFASFERTPLHPPYGGAKLPPLGQALLEEPGAGVFVDCLHFDPPFFAHLGRIRNDPALLDLAADQALAYADLLQQPGGLFAHFWLEKTARPYGHGWGRGQGWALLGLVDVLEHLPRQHEMFERLLRSFRQLAEALVASQRADGGWATVASEPASPAETSTAAFVAAGFSQGIRLGVLDETFLAPTLAAWDHARSAVDSSGALTGVSAAVWPATAASHYWNVPTGFVVPWGQGPLLLAAQRLTALGA